VAIDNGVLRYAARLVRLRPELSVEDLVWEDWPGQPAVPNGFTRPGRAGAAGRPRWAASQSAVGRWCPPGSLRVTPTGSPAARRSVTRVSGTLCHAATATRRFRCRTPCCGTRRDEFLYVFKGGPKAGGRGRPGCARARRRAAS